LYCIRVSSVLDPWLKNFAPHQPHPQQESQPVLWLLVFGALILAYNRRSIRMIWLIVYASLIVAIACWFFLWPPLEAVLEPRDPERFGPPPQHSQEQAQLRVLPVESYRRPSWSQWLRAMPALLPGLVALRFERTWDDLADVLARAGRPPRRLPPATATVRADTAAALKGGPHP
jgi:hypothetical protein